MKDMLLTIELARSLEKCSNCYMPATRKYNYEFDGGNGWSDMTRAICPNPACERSLRVNDEYAKETENISYAVELTAWLASLSEEEIMSLSSYDEHELDNICRRH